MSKNIQAAGNKNLKDQRNWSNNSGTISGDRWHQGGEWYNGAKIKVESWSFRLPFKPLNEYKQIDCYVCPMVCWTITTMPSSHVCATATILVQYSAIGTESIGTEDHYWRTEKKTYPNSSTLRKEPFPIFCLACLNDYCSMDQISGRLWLRNSLTKWIEKETPFLLEKTTFMMI